MSARRAAVLGVALALAAPVALAAAAAPAGLVPIGGGRSLFLDCFGAAKGPTVVLEAGLGNSTSEWTLVDGRASTFARVCEYDRAGRGKSPARTGGAPTAEQTAADLHALLLRAKVKPPYVFAGASLGGFLARVYAKAYPRDVAGLVMVESSWEAQFATLGTQPSSDGETIGVASSSAALLASGRLGARPLVVIARGRPFTVADDGPAASIPNVDAIWRGFQTELARRSTNSVLVVAKESGHVVARDQSLLVVEAIREVVAAVRAKTHLPPCGKALPRFGGVCLSG